MPDRDHIKRVAIVLAIVLSILLITFLFVGLASVASAESTTAFSTFPNITTLEQLMGIMQSNNIQYVHQGDTVYLNTTVDISGVLPGYGYLAYCDGLRGCNLASQVRYTIPAPSTNQGYYHFYIDPSIFANRLGWWIKWNGVDEPAGDLDVFNVQPPKNLTTMFTFPNGTVINLTGFINNGTYNQSLVIPPVVYPVPIKHAADYLVARGDSLNLTFNQTFHAWLFTSLNMKDSLYDIPAINGTLTLNASITTNIMPGNYQMVIQQISNQSPYFTLKYDPAGKTIQYFDFNSFTVQTIQENASQPAIIFQDLKNAMPYCLDNFTIYNLSVQDPTVNIIQADVLPGPNWTINQANQTMLNTNYSVLDVRGYTNVQPGENLSFVLDQNITLPHDAQPETTGVMVQNTTDPGDYRMFEVGIPVYLYNLNSGMHFITGYTNFSTDTGTTANFEIYVAPPNNFIPNGTIRYIAGQYGPQEWIPTPTPVTVIQTVTVPVTVIETVTPSDAQVQAAHDEYWHSQYQQTEGQVGVGVVLLVIAAWIVRIYFKRKAELKK